MESLKIWLPLVLAAVLSLLVPALSLAVVSGYLAAPAVRWLNGRAGLPPFAGALLTELFLIAAAASVILFAVRETIGVIPEIRTAFSALDLRHPVADELVLYADAAIAAAGERLLASSAGLIQTIFSRLFSFFIFLVAFYFALYESSRDRLWFTSLLPKRSREKAKKMFQEGGALFGTFLSVELRLSFLTFLILAAGLTVLGFPAAVGKAFLIALADSLPFLGIGVFLIPMAAYQLAAGNMLLCTAITILYAFVLLTRQIAETHLWASTLQLRPAHAFFIAAASILIFGLPGILLSPVLLFAAARIRRLPAFSGG
ncbi:AI-2E family transporter [Bhargavaea ullalensis]|uniref:PurR-regulated permease PerM n=1 Tax=Bhargavaea ullalensis TaxID=1265685 RepID=A0ABV2GCC9_9BACL